MSIGTHIKYFFVFRAFHRLKLKLTVLIPTRLSSSLVGLRGTSESVLATVPSDLVLSASALSATESWAETL